jgi:hypothetical protein
MGRIVFPFAQKPLGRDARAKVVARPLSPPLAPRVAHASVRVPDPRLVRVEIPFPSGHPQIFVHEGARQAFERKLQAACPRPVVLSMTDNRRSMIAFGFQDGILRARIHHMFLDAPPSVQEALVRYVAQGDREASIIVGRFIHDNNHRIRAAQPISQQLVTQGDHHDLLAIFQKLNDKYFGGTIDALVTWGRKPKVDGPRRTIKLGSYSATERLIRIHPVLDRGWVPRYFVSYVVYHEMIHHVVPAPMINGRKSLHPPAFLERERVFRDYDRALDWERAHVARLLRA